MYVLRLRFSFPVDSTSGIANIKPCYCTLSRDHDRGSVSRIDGQSTSSNPSYYQFSIPIPRLTVTPEDMRGSYSLLSDLEDNNPLMYYLLLSTALWFPLLYDEEGCRQRHVNFLTAEFPDYELPTSTFFLEGVLIQQIMTNQTANSRD